MEIKNLGQLIQHLATKAGVAADDANLVNILSNAELTKVTLHSDLVKAMDENLLSVDAATDNHPVIGPKYKAQALNAFDKKMEAVIEELGLDDTAKAELKGVKSSYDRFEKLSAKLKDLSTKKDNASGSADKVALQKQIDDLLLKMQNEQKTYSEKLASVENDRLKDRINFELKSLYGNAKTIYDQLDPAIKSTSIDAVINSALLQKEAKFAYDDKGSLVVLKNDGTNLVGANHVKYTPQMLIDEILAQNKILAVTQQQQNNNQQQQQGQQHSTIVTGNGQQINGTNQSVANMNLEAIAAFEKASS
jgi:hypothetical protein